MSRPASLSDDPRVRWTFFVNTYAKSWLWYPRGLGFLYCADGLLQFEPAGTIPFHRPVPFQHTARRVLLLSPWGVPNHFSVVVFEGGEVSVCVPRNRVKIREVLAECGFEVVGAPPQRMFPFNQRKAWAQHMGGHEQAAPSTPAAPRVVSERLAEGTVLGGVDKPMEISVPCPACRQPFELEYQDVQLRWYRGTRSVLDSHTVESFEAARPLGPDESVLDMHCPHCNAPMRMVVHDNEWRMSIYQYFIVEVLALSTPAP